MQVAEKLSSPNGWTLPFPVPTDNHRRTPSWWSQLVGQKSREVGSTWSPAWAPGCQPQPPGSEHGSGIHYRRGWSSWQGTEHALLGNHHWWLVATIGVTRQMGPRSTGHEDVYSFILTFSFGLLVELTSESNVEINHRTRFLLDMCPHLFK